MKAREFNRIWGKPWDWEYLLQIEKRKLKEMAEYFKRYQLTVGWEFQVRDCELCVKLIDIICEKDPYYRMWIENCYGETAFKNGTFRNFPVTKHINLNNIQRFLPHRIIRPEMLDDIKLELRQRKALYLYHKIRTYRMFTWWD